MKEEKDVAPLDFAEYLSLKLKGAVILVKVDEVYNILKIVLATVSATVI